jgi:hypothetical protein
VGNPLGWYYPSNNPENSHARITAKALDSEKITINLGLVDLGHADLLVQEGFYSNRTDFIRTAIRKPARHPRGCAPPGGWCARRCPWGSWNTPAPTSGRAQEGGEAAHPGARPRPHRRRRPATLAAATIESVTVLGALQASPAVKAALRGRIQ